MLLSVLEPLIHAAETSASPSTSEHRRSLYALIQPPLCDSQYTRLQPPMCHFFPFFSFLLLCVCGESETLEASRLLCDIGDLSALSPLCPRPPGSFVPERSRFSCEPPPWLQTNQSHKHTTANVQTGVSCGALPQPQVRLAGR